MRTIFHITSRESWESAKSSGTYVADTLKTEGFIHFSRPHQVLVVANSRFHGKSDLVLLHVAQESVISPVKYEGPDKSPFPHVYGPLNIDAVIGSYDFSDSVGQFVLPLKFSLVGDTLIRMGSPGDEAEIASVHVHAWQESYSGIVPKEILDARPLSFRNRMSWWRSIVMGQDTSRVLVAESAMHGIVAFCAFGPGRDNDTNHIGEIGAIYALNEYKNKGLGAALFRTARAALKSQNFDSLYLWVLKDNPTCGFYERMGGKPNGKEKTVEFGKPLIEIAYEWGPEHPNEVKS